MSSAKLYLDKRAQKKDGTYPVKITVSHKQKAFHIPLDVSVPDENWAGNKIEGNIKNRSLLNSYIQARLSSVTSLLLALKLNGKLDILSPDKLKEIILHTSHNDIAGENDPEENMHGEKLLFKEHAENFINSRNSEGTKSVYRFTLETIGRYYNIETLTFGDIDFNFLEDFNTKLTPTNKTNSRSIHFRNIRAIFRHAAKKKLISKDLYPFDDFNIKNEETPHRNLTVEELRTLRDYPVEPHQEQYRDLFMLLFYLIGINTVDLLHAEGVRNGRLEYRRAKTGKLYSIKLQPEAITIINKYSPGKKHLLNFLDNYTDYIHFRHRFNKNLKEIGSWQWIKIKTKTGRVVKKKAREPILPFLSSYYARHSWATIAADLDIPKETIAEALGHGKKSVTDRYINFSMRKVDEANRAVIDYLNSR